jgi:hypothetical protein
MIPLKACACIAVLLTFGPMARAAEPVDTAQSIIQSQIEVPQR